MKIVIDMNLSPAWVNAFADVNIEAIHWSTVGDPKATDRVIMQWAKAQGYIVFTNDLDFGAILAATQANSPSVIQVRTQDLLPDSIGKSVIQALIQFQEQLEIGALISIDHLQSRVRILPIQR
jgi:predicted nuclease of predicted toxin-antitoxin system